MRNTTIEDNIRKTLEKDFKCVEKFDTEKGGIYVETNEDPRGWMLGDKTRRIYEVPNLAIKTLTDLLVMVTSNHDGSEIKVSVYNPEEIGMMLLSKNDDVGSSIQYADIDVSKPVKLIAKMGEHINLESIMRGSWIRARIFPGPSILEIIKNDESEILELVEHTDMCVRKKIQELVGSYYETENEIDSALSGLRNYGAICDCDSPNVFKQIHEGEFDIDDIIRTCLKCGGIVE